MLDIDKTQGIIDFSKRKMNKIKIKKEAVNSSENVTDADIASKLATAKLHGQKEIEEYKKLVNELVKSISNMALFADLAPQLEVLCIDYLLNTVLEPVFKGHNIAGLPKSMFLEIRKDIFKELINKYCKEGE